MGGIAEFSAAAASVEPAGSLTLLVTYFAVAVVASFTCSMCEAVLLSLTGPYVAHLRKERPVPGERLGRLKESVDRPLAAILTLNTVANTIGSLAVGREVGQLAMTGGWGGWAEGAAAGAMCITILIAGEIIPKTIGASYWRQLAPGVGWLLNVMIILTLPVIWMIGLFRRGSIKEASFSREELKVMAEIGKSEGKLGESESRILHNLLHFRENTVQDVMTPRVVVFPCPCRARCGISWPGTLPARSPGSRFTGRTRTISAALSSKPMSCWPPRGTSTSKRWKVSCARWSPCPPPPGSRKPLKKWWPGAPNWPCWSMNSVSSPVS